MNEEEVRLFKQLKEAVQLLATDHGISPSLKLWLYDNTYLPVNNLLAGHGFVKHDDGQLS